MSTVAIATLAVFVSGGGLGTRSTSELTFKTDIILAGGIAVAMALVFDFVLVAFQRYATPWQRAARG